MKNIKIVSFLAHCFHESKALANTLVFKVAKVFNSKVIGKNRFCDINHYSE